MPSHDLNIPYTTNHAELSHTLLFSSELGYTTIALSIPMTQKLPSTLPSIPISQLSFPRGLTMLTRLTLTIADPSQNHRIASLQNQYDIIALRPVTEKALQLSCSSLECDLISLDFSSRLPFVLKFKTVASALQRGIRFEICYSSGITGGSDSKRNLIAGAMALIRATRGKGIVVSSEARSALGVRAPNDLVNLCCVWGLGQERGKEAVCDESAKVVRLARMRRLSYRGVVGGFEVVTGTSDDGEGKVGRNGVDDGSGRGNEVGPRVGDTTEVVVADGNGTGSGVKRKASSDPMQNAPSNEIEKPLSKREQKRRAKKARLENFQEGEKSQQKTDAFPIRHETLNKKS